jgi:hypothetical protein
VKRIVAVVEKGLKWVEASGELMIGGGDAGPEMGLTAPESSLWPESVFEFRSDCTAFVNSQFAYAWR